MAASPAVRNLRQPEALLNSSQLQGGTRLGHPGRAPEEEGAGRAAGEALPGSPRGPHSLPTCGRTQAQPHLGPLPEAPGQGQSALHGQSQGPRRQLPDTALLLCGWPGLDTRGLLTSEATHIHPSPGPSGGPCRKQTQAISHHLPPAWTPCHWRPGPRARPSP